MLGLRVSVGELSCRVLVLLSEVIVGQLEVSILEGCS